MVAYRWTCHACGSVNPAGSDQCAACGCAATASRASLERDLPEIQARNPDAHLEPQLPTLLLLTNLFAWAVTIVCLPLWFISRTQFASYLFLGAFIAAWGLRKLIGRWATRQDDNGNP